MRPTLQTSPRAQPLQQQPGRPAPTQCPAQDPLPAQAQSFLQTWLPPDLASSPVTTHPGATTWPGCAHSSRTTPARSDLSLRSARTQPPEPVRTGAGPEGCVEAAASHTASTEPMRTAAPAATLHSSRRSGPGPGQRTSATAGGWEPSAGRRPPGGASIAARRRRCGRAPAEAQGPAPLAAGGRPRPRRGQRR